FALIGGARRGTTRRPAAGVGQTNRRTHTSASRRAGDKASAESGSFGFTDSGHSRSRGAYWSGDGRDGGRLRTRTCGAGAPSNKRIRWRENPGYRGTRATLSAVGANACYK